MNTPPAPVNIALPARAAPGALAYGLRLADQRVARGELVARAVQALRDAER